MAPPNPNERPTADSPAIARRIGRVGVLLLCAAYLLTTAWFTVRHMIGDSLSQPFAYFFTWDMFPGYVTESSRRMVIGYSKQDDRFVKLLPAQSDRFRWGINNEVSRIDIDRNNRNLEAAIQRSVHEYNREHESAPITSVLVVEQYWPSRFNLPDDLYRQFYGEPNPHRSYWRMSVEMEVDQDGRIKSASDKPPEGPKP